MLHHMVYPDALPCLHSPGYGGSVGPHWYHWPQRSSSMYLISHLICQALCDFSLVFGNDGVILCLLFLHQGPQGDKGSRGETVRGAVLMNPFRSVL